MHRLYQTALCRNEDIGKTSICENALAALLTLKEKIISGCAPTVGSTSLNQHAKVSVMETPATAAVSVLRSGPMQGYSHERGSQRYGD